MNRKYFLVFTIASALLTAILLKGGNILGGGESGAPFYNITRMYEDSLSPWFDGFLGVYIPQVVANRPFLGILSKLAEVGASGVSLQVIFTLSSILVSLTSFYLLTTEIFSGYKPRAYALSSFYYLFNFYAVMGIWNRFLLNFILFYSVLPLFIWLYLRFLRREKLIYLGFFLLFSFILSYAFSSPAHIVIVWGLLTLATLFEYIHSRHFVRKLVIFGCTLGSWFLVNFWWVSQQIKFGVSESFGSIVAERFSEVGNSIGLASLSDALGRLENLYLLKHGLFYNHTSSFIADWPELYGYPLPLLAEWGILLLIFYWAIGNRKKVPVMFALGLLLAGIFMAKGVAAPFGEVFNFLFTKFTFVQFFRNPFEKLGIVAAIGISLMIGPAILDLEKFTAKKMIIRKLYVFVSFAFVVLFMGYPFWSGLVFTGSQFPFNDSDQGYQVKVPDYYKEADAWLSTENKTSRFATLPLGGEGIEYRWPKGYLGVEESQILFSNQSISNVISFPFYDQIASNIQRLFTQNIDFYRIASLLNMQYILYRPDIDFRNSGMKDPEYVEKIITNRIEDVQSKLSSESQFGPLKFYKYDKDAILPRVYASNSLIKASNNADLELYLKAGGMGVDTMYQASTLAHLEKYTNKYILRNNAEFKLDGQYPILTNAPNIFPYISRTPSFRFYSLVLLKEKLQIMFNLDVEGRLYWDILTLGKRLKEAEKAATEKDNQAVRTALELYELQLSEVIAKIHSFASIKAFYEQVWREGEMVTIFNSHLYIINRLEEDKMINSDGYVTALKTKFLEEVSEEKILPKFEPIEAEGFPLKSRIIYNFTIDSPGEYELFIPESIFFPRDFDIENQIRVQVDDKTELRQVVVEKGKVSFGKFNFEAGVHEFAFNLIPKTNLIESQTGFELNSDTQDVIVKIPIIRYDPYSQYLISFDYLISYGVGPGFFVSLNNNKMVEMDGKMVQQYHLVENLTPEDYFFGIKKYSNVINPDLSSDKMDLIFKLSPWNNCRKVFFKNPNRCNDSQVSRPFSRPSKVEISNLMLTPEHPKSLFALKSIDNEDHLLPDVHFEKLSSTLYLVSANEIFEPFVLVFSELFDRGWKAYIDGELLEEQNHILVNSYANGWFIDQPNTSLKIELRFEPHFEMEKAFFVSKLAFGSTALFTALLILKRKYVK